MWFCPQNSHKFRACIATLRDSAECLPNFLVGRNFKFLLRFNTRGVLYLHLSQEDNNYKQVTKFSVVSGDLWYRH